MCEPYGHVLHFLTSCIRSFWHYEWNAGLCSFDVINWWTVRSVLPYQNVPWRWLRHALFSSPKRTQCFWHQAPLKLNADANDRRKYAVRWDHLQTQILIIIQTLNMTKNMFIFKWSMIMLVSLYKNIWECSNWPIRIKYSREWTWLTCPSASKARQATPWVWTSLRMDTVVRE